MKRIIGKNTWKNIILLQAVIIIYSVSSVMAKLASANHEDISKFLIFFAIEFILLAVYAVCWQQMIKRFELTVAYANRAMSTLWSMVWAVFFFHDTITVKNICGVMLVIVGTLLINTDKGEREHD